MKTLNLSQVDVTRMTDRKKERKRKEENQLVIGYYQSLSSEHQRTKETNRGKESFQDVALKLLNNKMYVFQNL